MTRLFLVKLSLIMVILIYHKNKETFLLWLQLKTWGSFLEIRYFSFVNLSVNNIAWITKNGETGFYPVICSKTIKLKSTLNDTYIKTLTLRVDFS